MTALDKLKQIKLSFSRSVSFRAEGYTDDLLTVFDEDRLLHPDELVDILLDTAITYLEKKQQIQQK